MGERDGDASLEQELLERAGEETGRATARRRADAATVTLDAAGAFAWLERFLDIERRDRTTPSAAGLLGRRATRRYAKAFALRRGLFERVLGAAARLPPTRLDEARVGPAGTFLHHSVGDPARLVATWLELPHGYREGTTRTALLAYRDELAARGYASREALETGLPGAVCLGVLAALPGFPNAPDAPPGARREPAETLRDTLGALLDLGDTLTLARPDDLLEAVADYAGNGRAHRARRLLATRLEQVPDDVPCALALARAERERGRRERSRRVLERVARHRPDDARVARELAHARTVVAWLDEAEETTRMPRVALDADERDAGRFHDDTLDTAVELYTRHGTLLIEGAFEPALLDACREQFLDEYRDYLDGETRPDALQIGDRRFQVSIAIAGAFNDPRFYANPFVLALMRRLLDPQLIVGSTVCATSLPGARDQHLHKDHRALFTTDPDDDPPELPPVAVTTMIPLVDLDERIGTTLVRKGSHRRSRRASERLATQTPIVPLGSCFLMDLALSHQGQGNRTERVRPIVNMQYSRRWFADNKNFRKQRPLEIPPDEYARIPREHRSLFDWARQPGPKVDR